jgi:DNA-directed RNA polymerase subunit K/omega
MENQQMQEELSPEQLEARREEMKSFYESSIPYLEAQSKYEKLLTEVEEARYKRATMQLQYATMMAATQPQMEEEEEEQTKPTAQAPAAGKKLRKG